MFNMINKRGHNRSSFGGKHVITLHQSSCAAKRDRR